MALDIPTLRFLLSKFLPDERLIRAFEQWGRVTDDTEDAAARALETAREALISAFAAQIASANADAPPDVFMLDVSGPAPDFVAPLDTQPGTLTAGTGLTGGGNMGANVSLSIPNGGVTYALIQNTSAASVLIGRGQGSGAGVVQEITLGTGVSLSGTVLSASGSGGTVTSVSVVTANGVSGSVATPSTTPAITLTLGAITPTSVAAVGTVTGSNLSGTNTGDQTITLTGDVTGSGTGSFVTAIAAGVIVNADINASAAIGLTKLATVTASQALVSDASGFITASSVTATELGYLSGVTSAIQTQLNGKQATITPAALTKTDDTNVTLTLGGSPSTSLLAATSLALGWTGQLSVTRGGTGDSGTAWTTYSPTVAPTSGAFGSATTSAAYKTIGKTVFLSVAVNISANGTAAGQITITLPFTAARRASFAGAEPSLTGNALFASTNSSLTQIVVAKYDFTYAGGTGANIVITGVYEAA